MDLVVVGQRARIVLLAGEGVPNTEIAARVGVSRPTVHLWRNGYATGGIAALEVATGTVTDACFERHRHQEFLRFLTQVARVYPAASCTSCSTTTAPTSTPRSRRAARNRRIRLHFTPTSGS